METYEPDIDAKQVHKGYWSIPKFSAAEKFWGELEYDPETAIVELTLIGFPVHNFRDNVLIEKKQICFDCICGNLTSGKSITVINARSSSISFFTGSSTFEEISFQAEYFMLGDIRFENKDDIKFKSLSFRMTNLERWTAVTPFSHDTVKRKKKNSIHCTLPASIFLFEDEYVKIQISSESQSKLRHCEVDVTFNQKIKITCKRNRRLPFFGETKSFLYYISFVKSFFYLLIGRRILLFDFMVLVKTLKIKDPYTKSKMISLPNRVQIFAPVIFDKSYLVKLNADELMTVKNKLTQPLEVIFLNFIEDYHLYRDTLNIWHEVRSKSLVDEYTLSALLFCIEGLHRSLFPAFDEVPDEYAEKSADIQRSLSDVQWEFVKKEITYHCPFSKRVSETIKNCKVFFPEFSNKLRRSIAYDIGEKRNATAHFRKEEGSSPIPQYLVLLLLEEFIAILIFQHIGLKTDDLKACIGGQREHSFVVEKILQWQKTKNEQ